MRFVLIDRLIDFAPGKSIVMAKNVSMSEEYLADHFPGFPVLPGVLMLEAAAQAAAWLAGQAEDFAHSVVTLQSARQIRYGTFVAPGRTLLVRVELLGRAGQTSDLKVRATVDDNTALQGRIRMAHLNLAAADASFARADRQIIEGRRREWLRLSGGGSAALPAPAAARGAD